jgi:hypothetical protein
VSDASRMPGDRRDASEGWSRAGRGASPSATPAQAGRRSPSRSAAKVPSAVAHDLSLGNDELLPQEGVLCDQCDARPEEIGDEAASEAKEVEQPLPRTPIAGGWHF